MTWCNNLSHFLQSNNNFPISVYFILSFSLLYRDFQHDIRAMSPTLNSFLPLFAEFLELIFLHFLTLSSTVTPLLLLFSQALSDFCFITTKFPSCFLLFRSDVSLVLQRFDLILDLAHCIDHHLYLRFPAHSGFVHLCSPICAQVTFSDNRSFFTSGSGFSSVVCDLVHGSRSATPPVCFLLFLVASLCFPP